jgi:hypothetical protein
MPSSKNPKVTYHFNYFFAPRYKVFGFSDNILKSKNQPRQNKIEVPTNQGTISGSHITLCLEMIKWPKGQMAKWPNDQMMR